MPEKKKKSSLAETHPDIAKEADGWDPKRTVLKSNEKLNWKCKRNHRFSATVSSRINQRSGCPYCAKFSSRVAIGVNDLETTHPLLAKEAFGWDPRTVRHGSTLKRDWKCSLGHVWSQSPNQRTSKGTLGCPFCSNKIVLPGFNDLASTHPDLALEAFGWNPKEYSRGSSKKMEWKCSRGHVWTASISSRSRGNGCKFCANKAIQPGFNDLSTVDALLALEAFGWNPQSVGAGSSQKKKWKCTRGHIWEATVESRHSRGLGCPFCTNQRVLSGFNDLRTTHPILALEAFGWDPSLINAGSHKKLLWRCSLGHDFYASVAHRAKNESGCPTCSGKRVLIGFNDLATTAPALAEEADGWDPRTVTAGSGKRVRWRCNYGHTWLSKINVRSALQRGCPSCSKSGFDPNTDGWLYFLSHPDWLLLQIGITNHPADRIKVHNKLGWELLELRGPMDGLNVQEWETTILRHIKKQGGKFANKIGIEPFDGYSESWLKESFTFGSLKEIMDEIDSSSSEG